MAVEFNVVTVLLLVGGLLSLGLLALTVQHREERGALSLMGILLAVAIFTFGYLFRLWTEDPLWWKVAFQGGSLLTASGFVFALRYTGRDEYVTDRNVALLFVIPVLGLLLTIAVPEQVANFDGAVLEPRQLGIPIFAFWYLVGTAGFVLFFHHWWTNRETNPAKAGQSSLLAVGFLVPGVFGFVENSPLMATLGGDVSVVSFGYVLMGVILAVTVLLR